MEEIWKPIKGYEGIYEVSSYGRVRSLDRYVCRGNGTQPVLIRGNMKHPHLHCGYLYVGLNKDGKKKSCFVHRLVAEAFIPNPHNYPFINHKDEVRQNNHYENLEWCTKLYNNTYGSRKGKVMNASQMRRVIQMDMEGNFIAEYPAVKKAAKAVGIRFPEAITMCCSGKNKSAYGYKWKYAD